MYCSNCGKENDDKAHFCVKCGTPINGQEVKKRDSSTLMDAENKDIFITIPNKSTDMAESNEKGKKEKQTQSENSVVGRKKCKPIVLWGIILAVLVVSSIIITFILLTKGSKGSTYDEKVNLGHKYILELDYENAKIAFEDAIKKDSEKKDAYINLAEVYVKQGYFDKALVILEEARKNIKDTEEIKIIDSHRERIETNAKEYTSRMQDQINISGNPIETTDQTNFEGTDDIKSTIIPTPTSIIVSTPTPTLTPTSTLTPIPTQALVEIDDIAGFTKEEAQIYFDKKELKVKWNEEYDETVPKGYVIKTDPEAGTTVGSDSDIIVYLSKGINLESFKNRFETLVNIFTWKMAGNISTEDIEYMLLDVYLYLLNNNTVDYIFDIETGNGIPPKEIDSGLRGMNDDGTVPYIRCRLSDMKSFVKNVLGEKLNIEDGYILYGTFINKDGYLTEWGNNWFTSYEGLRQDITDFSYTYEGDIIIASYRISSYWADTMLESTQYTTYWKPNSKSTIGYTLKNVEKNELYNKENENSNNLLTEDQAIDAIVNYCYIYNPDLKELIDSGEAYLYWDIVSCDDNEIVVLYRSYTGAQIRYYINRLSGDVYITEFVPGITDEEVYTGENFNVEGYLH